MDVSEALSGEAVVSARAIAQRGNARKRYEQTIRKQHQPFLADLNERLLPLSDPDEILWQAVNLIGPFLQLNRCHFGDLDFVNDRFTLHRSYLHEATSTVGSSPISAYGPPPFVQALQQGQTIVVHDAATDSLVSSYYDVAYFPMNVGAFIAVPCMSVGRCVGALVVDTALPRKWMPEEIQLLQAVVNRVWLAVENTRLYQQAQRELQQRQAAQEALQAERERLAAIIAEMPTGVMLISAEGKLLLVNREAERIYAEPDLLNLPPDEFDGWSVYRLDGTRLPREDYMVMRSLTTGEIVRNEECLLERRDGTRVPLLVNCAPLRDGKGAITACVLIFADIAAHKKIEEEILALNTHLRLGIQETHHRIKNNLQVIYAMLEMCIQDARQDARDALPLSDAQRIANQVLTLAKVHEILTSEARFDRFNEAISSRLVLEPLLPMLKTTDEVRLAAHIADVPLSVQQATALALVANELGSNAVKHGRGEVEILFAVSADRGILLVSDNGPGFPPDFDLRTTANAGLLIAEQMVRHNLRGTLTFANRQGQTGAEVRVTVPLGSGE